jgi:oligopeptide transport system permease protein
LRAILKWTLLGVLTVVGIFFLSNVGSLFINQAPDKLRAAFGPGIDWNAVTSQLPGTTVVDPKAGILAVPYGRTQSYSDRLARIQGIYRVSPVPVEPAISWHHYTFVLKDQLNGYLHGDLGSIRNTASNKDIPIRQALKDMAVRTCSYFVPGLLLAAVLGVGLSIAASLWRRLGKALDGVHALLVGLPDFILIVLLQLAAIYISKFTEQRVILIVQLGKEAPFLIPFLTIALVPGVLLYGTMRLAFQRELSRDYVATARAKGLSRREVLLNHVFRNVLEDLLTALPKATTLALAGMAVAEAICNILGLGGYIVNPVYQNVNATPVTCVLLAAVAIAFHGLYAMLRRTFVISTKEAS